MTSSQLRRSYMRQQIDSTNRIVQLKLYVGDDSLEKDPLIAPWKLCTYVRIFHVIPPPPRSKVRGIPHDGFAPAIHPSYNLI